MREGECGNGPATGRDNRLRLVEKLKQTSVLPAVLEVSEGVPLAAPLVVELDPTTVCDLACPECISGQLLQQGGFSSDRLLQIGDELVEMGVKAVILIGGGEPLLHPAVGSLVERLGTGGIHVGVTTNGTQLSRYRQLLLSHAAWVRVSVDAATRTTYRRFRPHRGSKDVFAQVIEGMRSFIDSRVEGNGCELGYSFLVMSRQHGGDLIDTNVDEIAAAARLAKEIGCDYFEVKPEYDLGHNVLSPHDGLIARMADQIGQASGLEDERFSVITPGHLQRVIDGLDLDQPKDYHRCPIAELRTLVTPSGAYVCPYHRGNDQARYGDPAEEGFSALWRGEERPSVMDDIKPSRDCGFNCIRHESNKFIRSLAASADPAQKELRDFDRFI
jgi:organic radical activating enzyme